MPNANANTSINKWQQIEKGLYFQEFTFINNAKLFVLKINPKYFSFKLYSSDKDKKGLHSIDVWAKSYDLVAAINASMYLEDGKTSTGFMKDGDYINNKKIAAKLGAFFVAGPNSESLPEAMIIEKDDPDFKNKLSNYRLVIQNYRMITKDKKILWPKDGALHSIAAIGEDENGNILFMHCKDPIDPYSFATQTLSFPLKLSKLMYVEGGGQACLIVNTNSFYKELLGFNAVSLLISNDFKAELPNIIGIQAKH